MVRSRLRCIGASGNSYKLALYMNCAGLDPRDASVSKVIHAGACASGQAGFLRARTEASFAVAEKHLADRAFVLGDRPGIVASSFAGYVYYPKEETGFDIAADYPAPDAWRKRLAAPAKFA